MIRQRVGSQTRHVLFLGALSLATMLAVPAFANTTQDKAAHPGAEKHRLAEPHAAKATHPAHAAEAAHGAPKGHANSGHPVAAHANSGRAAKSSKMVYSAGISCVPYARLASGISVKGNAANWWANAAGIYARGSMPEPGSVLNFRATGHMRLGHVAVVTQVVSAREVIIDHANWAGPGLRKGMVSKGVPVIDVSPNNDWTAVRVALGGGENFGSTYPTYGFIYDRPDNGTMIANTLGRSTPRYEEVAEAPATPAARR